MLRGVRIWLVNSEIVGADAQVVFEQPHVDADVGFLGFLPCDVGEILVVNILYPTVDVLRLGT